MLVSRRVLFSLLCPVIVSFLSCDWICGVVLFVFDWFLFLFVFLFLSLFGAWGGACHCGVGLYCVRGYVMFVSR